jgi:hypothetical protein
MAERKVKVNLPGVGMVDGTPVQILESVDRWSEIKLEDGTTLRLKPVVLSVNRIDGRYDNEGNPMYAVQAGQAMTANAPDHLRKSDSDDAGKVH